MKLWPVFSWDGDRNAELLISVHSSEKAAERACEYYKEAFGDGWEDSYFVGVYQILDVVQLGVDDLVKQQAGEGEGWPFDTLPKE
jgi:hypothetical protein